METLAVSSLRIDDTQMRVSTSEDTVAEYAAIYADSPDLLPPPVVFHDGSDYWTADGIHRVLAALRAKLTKLKCEVRKGTKREAILYAVGANSEHGLKRTNADKRNAVATLLKDDEWGKWADRQIARLCKVGAPLVADVRKSLTVRNYSEKTSPPLTESSHSENGRAKPSRKRRYKTKHGTEAEMDTSKIGKEPPPAESEPEQTAPPPPDEWNIPIQPHALEAFAALPQFKELTALLKQAQKLFNEVANLPGGKFLTMPAVSSFRRGRKEEGGTTADRFVNKAIDEALKQVQESAPAHTVCPYQYVDAPHPEDCRCCMGLNWTPALAKSIPSVCKERQRKAFGVGEGD